MSQSSENVLIEPVRALAAILEGLDNNDGDCTVYPRDVAVILEALVEYAEAKAETAGGES